MVQKNHTGPYLPRTGLIYGRCDSHRVLRPTPEVFVLFCRRRYSWDPYDTQGSGPLGRILRLLTSLPPVFFASYLICAVMFVLMDKTDEHQLTKFILDFKGMQAISTGLLYALIGIVNYMSCANEPQTCVTTTTTTTNSIDNTTSTTTTTACESAYGECEDSFLATYPTFWIMMIAFALTLLWVWVAFILVLLMHRRALKQADGDLLKMTVIRGHYSRTRFWLLYDIVTFLICCCIVGYYLSRGDAHFGEWQRRQLFFWCKVLYSLLSFPFIFFMLPLFHLLFNHSPATGYDRDGKCRRIDRTSVEGGAGSAAEQQGVKFANPMSDVADEEDARNTGQAFSDSDEDDKE